MLTWTTDLPRVFLAYRHGTPDQRIVHTLVERLTRELCTDCEPHLRKAELYFDRERLIAGDAWEPILRQELHSANIYLFVVSLHSAADSNIFMWREEFPVAAKRWWEGTAWIIPIIVDDVTTILDNDERTRFLSQNHSAPSPRAGFKTLLEEAWFNAVTLSVKEACMRFSTQIPWDADQEREARFKAEEKLSRVRELFESSSFPLGGVTGGEAHDMLEAAAAALKVKGPSTRDSISRVAQTLERGQMRLQRFDAEFDALGELISRLKFLARIGREDEPIEGSPVTTDPRQLGAELTVTQADIRSAEAAVAGLRAQGLRAPVQARELVTETVQQIESHLRIAGAAANAPEVDVDMIAAQIGLAQHAAVSLSERAIELGDAVLDFLERVGRTLRERLVQATQAVAQLLRRREVLEAPAPPPPELSNYEYFCKILEGWKLQMEHLESRYRYLEAAPPETFIHDLKRTFGQLPLPPALVPVEIAAVVENLRTFAATFRIDIEYDTYDEVHGIKVQFSIMVRESPAGSSESPILQLSLIKNLYHAFELGGGRPIQNDVIAERVIHF